MGRLYPLDPSSRRPVAGLAWQGMTGLAHTEMMRDETGQDRGMNITNACSPVPAEGYMAATKRAPGRGGQAPLRGCAGRGIRRLPIERIAERMVPGHQ